MNSHSAVGLAFLLKDSFMFLILVGLPRVSFITVSTAYILHVIPPFPSSFQALLVYLDFSLFV
jgi:hypothetical protein